LSRELQHLDLVGARVGGILIDRDVEKFRADEEMSLIFEERSFASLRRLSSFFFLDSSCRMGSRSASTNRWTKSFGRPVPMDPKAMDGNFHPP
jgi:hypothetical protein